MTVQPYETPTPLPAVQIDPRAAAWVSKLRAAAEIASYIGGTEFVPESLRNRPEAIAAAIMFGESVGLEPMVALSKVVIIKGKPTLTAEAQRSLILAAGHELWFEESTVTRAVAAGRRAGSERVARITWTADDAKRAGIGGQQNWRTYPAEMLRARASAALARVLFADVIGGLAAAEELEGDANGIDPTPVDVEPPAKTIRTRKRSAAKEPARDAVTPPPPPDAQPEPEVGAEPLLTDAQRRQLFALMRDLGIAERQERLDVTANAIGRAVESSSELTIGEASTLIEKLNEVAERKKKNTPEQEQAVLDVLKTELDAKPVDDKPEPVPFNEFPADY